MQVKQVYTLLNDTIKEVLGETAVVQEDLTGLVELGDTISNAVGYDKYVGSLVNHIGRVIFVNRKYQGSAPSVLMDGWEFGSILEKVSADLPEATENESWELTDGASYDQNIFYQPKVSVKFFNKKATFEIPMSFTEKQVKQSFSNAEQMNAFLSMLYNAVDKAMTVNIDMLIMRTINNFIGETIYDEYGSGSQTGSSGPRAVNLLYLYNQTVATPITAAAALYDKNFIRFAAYILKLYAGRMGKISKLFNIGGKERFTPRELLHIVLLDEFDAAASVYLQSDTFHNELVKLPQAETVPFWQGSGTGYAFSDTGTIDIVKSDGTAIKVTGVLGVMWDRDALGVCQRDRRVTTHYNAKAEFYNNWYKFDAEYFNDLNENFVVFFVA